VCTVVLSLEPGEPVPLRLLGIRDELVSRPWRPPARHWPGSPLIGGIDEQAGGTWLAVHPGVPRVACLLNARGPLADPGHRRSRGDLSLRAAAEGHAFLRRLAGDPDALAAYDPFHLICGTWDAVTMISWPGRLSESAAPNPSAPNPGAPSSGAESSGAAGRDGGVAVRDLAPGTHLITNAGHAYPIEPGDPEAEPKADHFADKFGAARPPADPALPLSQAWGDWLTLAAGDGLDPADPAGIIIRGVLPDGRVHGTTSVTLVALADGAVRYDFQPHPGRPDGWYPVPLA